MLDCDTAIVCQIQVHVAYTSDLVSLKRDLNRDYRMLFKTLNSRIDVNNNSIINVGTRYGWL